MKRHLKIIALVLAGISGSAIGPVNGQDMPNDAFDQAVQDYQNKNYTAAYGAFFKLAQDGHGAAQLNLAILTAKGDGIIQNNRDALYWAWRARLSGETQAISVVDYLTAQTLPQEHESVAYELRFTYSDQFEQGTLGAAFRLGRVYNELYTPADIDQAFIWFSIASAFDIKFAKAFRETVGRDLTIEQRNKLQADAQAMTTQWCIRQADQAPKLCHNVIMAGS